MLPKHLPRGTFVPPTPRFWSSHDAVFYRMILFDRDEEDEVHIYLGKETVPLSDWK